MKPLFSSYVYRQKEHHRITAAYLLSNCIKTDREFVL